MSPQSLPLYRLFIYHRHCIRAGTITNEPVGDDTYELVGTAPDLRAYAESGIEAQSKKPMDSDRVHLERVYKNILDLLDTADMSYYEAREPSCIIEAMHPDLAPNWDSDRVGNESFPMSEAKAHMERLEADPDWSGWHFRLLADDGTGAYRAEVTS